MADPGPNRDGTSQYVWSAALGQGSLPGLVASAVGYTAVGLPQQIHRGLPSPYLTFIFSLDDAIVSASSAAEAAGAAASRADVLIAGLHVRPTYVVQPTHQAGVQLSVHPLAARALFGVSTADLGVSVLAGDVVLGREADVVRERLLEAPDWASRFDLLAGYLQSRLARSSAPPPRPELVEAWSWLGRHRGAVPLDSLGRQVAMSPRQLRSLFVAEVGLSPKKVARLMRFEHAKQRIAGAVTTSQPLNLTETAHSCGYCDHAHLVREFGDFAGVSPTGWIAEERRNIQAGGHRNGEKWDT